MKGAAFLVVFAALLPAQAPMVEVEDDGVFTGTLERVMDESITVLLPDARLIDARLPNKRNLTSSVLSDNYKFGSQVTVRCKPIEWYWDKAADLPRMLELKSIQLNREATPEELRVAITNQDWKRPGNLLKPPQAAIPAPAERREPPKQLMRRPAPEEKSAPPQFDDMAQPPEETAPAAKATSVAGTGPQAILERARAVNLDRSVHMPNFVADEVVDCYGLGPGQSEWKRFGGGRTEVAFTGGVEERRNPKTGKPIRRDDVPQGCPMWSGGFASFLRPTFDLECLTAFEFSRTFGRPENQGFLYTFSTPPEGCFGMALGGYQRVYPAYEGFIVIQVPGNNMIHLTLRSMDMPTMFPIRGFEQKVTWNQVKIGDTVHLLPVSYEKVMAFSWSGKSRIVAKYSNHRHFEANSGIAFQK